MSRRAGDVRAVRRAHVHMEEMTSELRTVQKHSRRAATRSSYKGTPSLIARRCGPKLRPKSASLVA